MHLLRLVLFAIPLILRDVIVRLGVMDKSEGKKRRKKKERFGEDGFIREPGLVLNEGLE